jgi:putative transposase
VSAIPQLMKRLAGRQTRFVNALEKRSGSLWEGRYKISPIDTDAYLLACCRYVELNPVKASMVEKAELYAWSSYPARLGMKACDWLDEPDTFRSLAGNHPSRIEAYRRFFECEDSSKSDELIGSAINSNKLTGGAKFVEEIERRIGIRVETRKPGRPPAGK